MIKVSVLYPNGPGSHFDVEYYLTVHMPMSVRLLGPALKAVSAEIGVSGAESGETPPYAAIAGFTCESREAFTRAFTPVADQLQGDIPRYTNIQPIIQISELNQFVV
jgi:uncharacterized protein (TIGR02118 family)